MFHTQTIFSLKQTESKWYFILLFSCVKSYGINADQNLRLYTLVAPQTVRQLRRELWRMPPPPHAAHITQQFIFLLTQGANIV